MFSITNAYQTAAKMNIRAKLQWARRGTALGLSLAEVSEVRSFFWIWHVLLI